ncbi:hydrogen gas-evolving membrane-bound hydrogenase subunit E [Saccharicrinis aurantiacus]|uniref:hydrogen gas-evolving membrane-bound hydrogenase subunit E n=1 Tax=Saccharicrinis aurantiacus TaxID=1849719 RepID=UPI002491D3C3|nr:hydrogen gas-evolving membrane-bound hydrogenase subunit E [Saccharicrinis aurantiacus]
MILSAILITFLSSLLPFLFAKAEKIQGWLVALIPTTLLASFISLDVLNKGNIVESNSWLPELGLNINFYIDGLSSLFIYLILGMGIYIFAYANGYMKNYKGKSRFYSYLIVFMAAMLGLVSAGNMILLFVFWELTSISSFLLISFFHDKEDSRKSALQALLITGIGGLAILGGVIIIGAEAGSYEIQDWINNADTIISGKYSSAGLILILLGAFTKSAQFPFHFWLPNAMAAPTPVSAYLHSATMVKAGVFLLLRVGPIFSSTELWQTVLPISGSITFLLGAFFACVQTDLKKIFAYTTISSLGVLVMLIGIDTDLSIKAAFMFLLVHSLYKGALFMLAGIIDKKVGTRDIRLLGNLWTKMPLITIVGVLVLLSMAGLPPLIGFLGKEMIYEAKLQIPEVAPYMTFFSVLGNVFMVFISLYVAHMVFFRKEHKWPKEPSRAGISMAIGPFFLASLSLIFGLLPQKYIQPYLQSAITAIKPDHLDFEIHLWHGFNHVLLLSIATVAMGVMLFIYHRSTIPFFTKVYHKVFVFNFSDQFFKIIDGFIGFNKKIVDFVQHGYQRYYLSTIFIFTAAFLWYIISQTWHSDYSIQYDSISWALAIISIIIVALSFLSLPASLHRVSVITITGGVGYAMSAIYLFYGAIDLAVTQILVDSLTVILMVLVLPKLPKLVTYTKAKGAIRDLLIASSFGIAMGVIAFMSATNPSTNKISTFFEEFSLSIAHGKNIVNVILVDFRGIDTMGEITVLVLASLGIYSLLKIKKTH